MLRASDKGDTETAEESSKKLEALIQDMVKYNEEAVKDGRMMDVIDIKGVVKSAVKAAGAATYGGKPTKFEQQYEEYIQQ